MLSSFSLASLICLAGCARSSLKLSWACELCITDDRAGGTGWLKVSGLDTVALVISSRSAIRNLEMWWKRELCRALFPNPFLPAVVSGGLCPSPLGSAAPSLRPLFSHKAACSSTLTALKVLSEDFSSAAWMLWLLARLKPFSRVRMRQNVFTSHLFVLFQKKDLLKKKHGIWWGTC